MLKIKTLILGELSTNCHLVWDPGSSECIVIDPADEGEFISETILRLGLKPRAAIATHGHFDHILAAFSLTKAFSIPFFVSEKDLFLVKNMRKNAKYFLGRDTDPPPKPRFLEGLKTPLKLGSEHIKVVHTPGHTPGSVCFVFPESKVLFAGDLLFADGSVGRTDFSYSDPSQLASSVRKTLSFPEDYEVYCGHLGPSGISALRKLHEKPHL